MDSETTGFYHFATETISAIVTNLTKFKAITRLA
jgi:hypothetical protein